MKSKEMKAAKRAMIRLFKLTYEAGKLGIPLSEITKVVREKLSEEEKR